MHKDKAETVESSVTVERIEGVRGAAPEGQRVIFTDGRTSFELPLSYLPADTREGDVFRLCLTRDDAERAKRKSELGAQLNRLADDDDGGDFSL